MPERSSKAGEWMAPDATMTSFAVIVCEMLPAISAPTALTPSNRMRVAVLSVMIELHRLLARLDVSEPAYAEILALRDAAPDELLALDLDAIAERLNQLCLP